MSEKTCSCGLELATDPPNPKNHQTWNVVHKDDGTPACAPEQRFLCPYCNKPCEYRGGHDACEDAARSETAVYARERQPERPTCPECGGGGQLFPESKEPEFFVENCPECKGTGYEPVKPAPLTVEELGSLRRYASGLAYHHPATPFDRAVGKAVDTIESLTAARDAAVEENEMLKADAERGRKALELVEELLEVLPQARHWRLQHRIIFLHERAKALVEGGE